MTGKSQSEAVAVLRNAPAGSKVRIVVSRQEDVLDNGLPRVIVSINNNTFNCAAVISYSTDSEDCLLTITHNT